MEISPPATSDAQLYPHLQASTFASYIVFVGTGIVAMLSSHLPFQTSKEVKVMLFLTILANAFFFFLYEGFTESSVDMKTRLMAKRPFEWWLRVLAQAELFNLWFMLQWGWTVLFIFIGLLYLTYVWWDVYTWACFKQQKRTIFYLDLLGLGASVLGLFAFTQLARQDSQLSQQAASSGNNLPWIQADRDYMIIFTIVMLLYVLIAVLGYGALRKSYPSYKPFSNFNRNLT